MSSSFRDWLKHYLKGDVDDWISPLAEYYEEKYGHPLQPDWVKEGIIESYRVVTETYKSLILAIASGLVSLMVAQIPSETRIIPLFWNLFMIFVAAILVIIVHLRMSFKISILNARLDAICGIKGEVLAEPEESEQT